MIHSEAYMKISRGILMAEAIAGACAGMGTLILVSLIYQTQSYWGNHPYILVTFIGNCIIYFLPVVIGGTLVGLVTGTLSVWILGSVRNLNMGARKGAIIGSIWR
jgi:hypothetical protein